MSGAYVKIAIFIFALVGIASLNLSAGLQRMLGFDRHMPVADAFTIFWMISGAILLCAQAFFDFSLFDLMPQTLAQGVYGLVGASAAWQASRQK